MNIIPTEVISNIYLNFGILGLIVIAFFVLLIWVVKTGKEREERLYVIIDTLSKELPAIRETVNRIENKIK